MSKLSDAMQRVAEVFGRRKKAAIANKFSVPRGVLSKSDKGSELFLEGGKKLSADTPEGAEQLLETIYGDKPVPLPTPDKEALAKRLQAQKAEKMLDKEGNTLSQTDPVDGTEFAGKNDKSLSGKAVRALSAPQRKLFAFAAEKLGVKGDEEDSEASAQNIVEKAAEKLGVPEDSAAGNVAKALGVAGLETFADPTNLIPAGKLAKLVGKAGSAVKAAEIAQKVVDTDKIAELIRKSRLEKFLEATSKRGKSAAEMLRDKGAQEIKGAKIFKGTP